MLGCDKLGMMVEMILIGLAGIIDIFVLGRIYRALRMLHMPEKDIEVEGDLPTVSICITARNETHAMTQCLERVVASDYPKLEVIVLDDGSRDNTSTLIKSFAYAGVRFIEGKPLPEDWLGKNYAQSILASEASGQYVFFMDVDTLVDRHTLMRTVKYMVSKKARMVSVIPIRSESWQISTLMTPMRYFWAMVRFSPSKPRAVSNAWIIERKIILEELNRNKHLPLSMLMETTIARKLAKTRKFRLVMSNKWLGIRYEKKWSSQVETSIRLLYPQCSRFWLQMAWLIVLLGIVALQYLIVWWEPWAWVTIALQYAVAYAYLSHVWLRYRAIGALLVPVTLVQEMILIANSWLSYKMNRVTWKGRPIRNLK